MPTSEISFSGDATASRRRRWVDLALGVALGLALGIAIVAAFVFLGSEGSVDAPRISGVDTGKPAQHVVPKARQ
jgi:hypothetical protein